MPPVIYPTLSAAKIPLSRAISSLAPGHILRGVQWNYRIVESVKGDSTHISTVFKAEVVPHENDHKPSNAPQWAFIKAASPSDKIAAENLDRERQVHLLRDVASAKCFREMYDVIDNSTIALEWLDTTLAEVKYQPDICIYSLIGILLKQVLNSCVVLGGYELVNTDLKPANILLSGIESGNVTAKIGDLGLVRLANNQFNQFARGQLN